jgi:hypothetical protein
MQKRWLTGAALTVSLGLSTLGFSTPALANYDKCPDRSLCLYQDWHGKGSKAIITPYQQGELYSFHGNIRFLNGQDANDQVSSLYNRSRFCVELFPDFGRGGTDVSWAAPEQQLDYSPDRPNQQVRFNDQFSSVLFTACS